MDKTYVINNGQSPTKEQLRKIEETKKLPIVLDDTWTAVESHGWFFYYDKRGHIQSPKLYLPTYNAVW